MEVEDEDVDDVVDVEDVSEERDEGGGGGGGNNGTARADDEDDEVEVEESKAIRHLVMSHPSGTCASLRSGSCVMSLTTRAYAGGE